jgi:hypothetical protein
LKWLPWADAGFPTPTHLYKNPREMKREKHRPKPEIEKVARELLGQKMDDQ